MLCVSLIEPINMATIDVLDLIDGNGPLRFVFDYLDGITCMLVDEYVTDLESHLDNSMFPKHFLQ